ncbi:hypothetical protein HYR99_06840 [Candidatus Poribacteria bacterium]|nr:hypothetical protein [Candidatus Poribacteria bacterium]
MDGTTLDSSVAAPDTVIDVDYEIRKSIREFKQSNTAIELASKRARDDDEMKQVVGFAEKLVSLALQMEELLNEVAETEQQRNEIKTCITGEAQALYERLKQMLKANEEALNYEADRHDQPAGMAEERRSA